MIRWCTVMVLLASACSAPIEETVVYDERYGASTSMDLYLPERGAARPAVMLVHGGSWRSYHKDRYRTFARMLARAGYVSASVEYRLVPEGAFPAAVQDVGCALSYLRNHADELGIDPARIAAMGYSAGGHLVSLVGVGEDLPEIAPDCAEGPTYPPAAVISGAGPQDLFALSEASVVRDFLGGTPEERYDTYVAASPILHVHPDAPPFLLIHGSVDQIAPESQSARMREALREQGVPVDMLVIRLTGHILQSSGELGDVSIETSEDAAESFVAISAFLERTIGRP